jgi:putative ABC transport system permease protein
MNLLRTIWLKLRSLCQRREVKREIDEELRFHLEQRTAENLAAGMSPEDAAREARKRFGSFQSVREECRNARGASFGETTLQDVGFGLRMLRKNPGFTAVAVLMLALGIGANTAIFSIVYGVLLRPLPCPEQDRLVTMSEWSKQVPGMSISYPNFLDWRAQQTSFTAIGVSRGQSFNYQGSSGTERVRGTVASYDFFAALGMPALRGRLFQMGDDQAGAERTVLIGEGFWQRSFGGRDSALGEKIQLSGDFYTIIGVLPDAVQRLGGSADLAVPLGLWSDQYRDRGNHPGLYAVARLKPGVAFAAAEAEMRTIGSQLAREYPASNAGVSIEMQRFTDSAFGSVRTALLVLLGAAAFVLLIACANVANLQLARAQARGREFAIRAALGAGRGRVVFQLLVESLLLGLLGTVTGLGLGRWAVAALRAIVPANIPRLEEVALNGWVLAFAIGAGLLTSVLFGLAPASYATGQDLRTAIAPGTRTGGAAGGRRWRAALIVGEFALTCLLVGGAALMLRTLANLHRADLGYSTEHILTFDFDLAGPAYRQPVQRVSLIERGLERIAALPGVKKVALVNPLPMRGGNQSTYYVEGAPVPGPGQAPSAERIQVNSDYFSTLGISLMAGRTFGAQDAESSPRVAIVDTVFAEKYFHGQNPLRKRFAYGEKPPDKESDWMQIVGVVGHIRNFGLRGSTREQTYVAFTQNAPAGATFALRTERDPAALIPALRGAMREVAGDLPIFNFRTMNDRFTSSISMERLTLLLLGVFAALALVLAAVGLYGVLNYTVGQRTREIGIRVALGATSRSIRSMTMKQGLQLASAGLLIGLAAALALTRFLRSMLYEVSPFDPLSFGIVAFVLAGVGVIACWLPARRAAKISPMEALRSE